MKHEVIETPYTENVLKMFSAKKHFQGALKNVFPSP